MFISGGGAKLRATKGCHNNYYYTPPTPIPLLPIQPKQSSATLAAIELSTSCRGARSLDSVMFISGGGAKLRECRRNEYYHTPPPPRARYSPCRPSSGICRGGSTP